MTEDLDGQGTTLNDLDPGIRKVVERLLEAGFATCDSGDGYSKLQDPEAGYECGEIETYPHVYMQCGFRSLLDECARLLVLVRSWGITVGSIGEEAVFIQATYDPVNESAIIGLHGLLDHMLLVTS